MAIVERRRTSGIHEDSYPCSLRSLGYSRVIPGPFGGVAPAFEIRPLSQHVAGKGQAFARSRCSHWTRPLERYIVISRMQPAR